MIETSKGYTPYVIFSLSSNYKKTNAPRLRGVRLFQLKRPEMSSTVKEGFRAAEML